MEYSLFDSGVRYLRGQGFRGYCYICVCPQEEIVGTWKEARNWFEGHLRTYHKGVRMLKVKEDAA